MIKSYLKTRLCQLMAGILVFSFANTQVVLADDILADDILADDIQTEDIQEENILEENAAGVAAKETADAGWNYVCYGNGAYGKHSGYEGSIKADSIRLYALNGEGKLDQEADDGLTYYYYAVPAGKNFTLKAKCHVNEWTYSGNQSGFGIMAADRTGQGTKTIWNNSVAAQASNYKINKSITMKMGVCSLAKYGLTKKNEEELLSDEGVGEAVKKYYTIVTSSLDKKAESMPYGTYNIIGNSSALVHGYDPDRFGIKSETNPTGYEPCEVPGTLSEHVVTDLTLSIEKNNSGYFASYEDVNGVKNTKRNPIIGKDPLLSYDSDYVYIGFFAAQNVDITFSDIEFEIRDSDEDEPAVSPEPNYMDLSIQNVTTPYSNKKDYEMLLRTNWNGKYVYKDQSGKKVCEGFAKADEYIYLPKVTLSDGQNKLRFEFEPDKNFHYGYDEYHPLNYSNCLKTYDVKLKAFYITYHSLGNLGKYIYVAPNATEKGSGTKDDPIDLGTAARYVQPGQTIKLAGGVYVFEDNTPVNIRRGIDGTADKYIRLEGNDDDANRSIIDFNKKGMGMICAGNYWFIKNIDVRNSANGTGGLHICGNYCIVDGVRTYLNGNTGLGISRYSSYDTRESDFWPHDNIVRNCLSYENADIGYEDADGFSAKITVGKNNVFDNCVAHHNSDDGWDLYAKKQIGNIDSVRITNCVAYSNGYVHENGVLVDAGNGNGFKLGGESQKGGHILTGSYAFYNKEKGIDSNNCPDIKVYNNVSFDNGKNNVALYSSAPSTDFEVRKTVSFRKSISLSKPELFSVKQDNADAYKNSTVFCWDNKKNKSLNTEGIEFKEEYFKSLEFDPEKDEIARNEDGTINMRGFLEFVDDIDEKVGFELTKRELEDPVIYPDKEWVEEPEPTSMPTPTPTKAPTSTPTPTPTKAPTSTPTPTPTKAPTSTPTPTPTKAPTSMPTPTPTKAPTSTPTPTIDLRPAEIKEALINTAKLFGKKKADGNVLEAAGESDNLKLITIYKNGKATCVTIDENQGTEGLVTIAAGTKLTLPGIEAGSKASKNVIYTIRQLNGEEIVSDLKYRLKFNDKNTKAAIKVNKGLVSTRAVKDAKTKKYLPSYCFTISYNGVDGQLHKYDVTVLNLGFDKKKEKTEYTREVTAESEEKVVIDLEGLGAENTVASTTWVVQTDDTAEVNGVTLGDGKKQAVLVPGVPIRLGTAKKGYFATALLADDGKSVLVTYIKNQPDEKGKILTGKALIRAYVGNAKVMKTSVTFKAAKKK